MAGSRTPFWNERYAQGEYAYGTRPNAFVQEQAHRLPASTEVLELGAGEGRNAVWLAREGHDVTVVDFAEVGLRKAERLAERHGVHLGTMHADVLAWQPARRWDAVVTTFLHLPSHARPHLYRLVRLALRPGGLFVAEWFRPEQITRDLSSGGPPSLDLMVTSEELREHFPPPGIELLEDATVTLDEGSYHRGEAAVVRLIWQKPHT